MFKHVKETRIVICGPALIFVEVGEDDDHRWYARACGRRKSGSDMYTVEVEESSRRDWVEDAILAAVDGWCEQYLGLNLPAKHDAISDEG